MPRHQITASPRFLSTPSSQRATTLAISGGMPYADFYPRPLRRGRHCALEKHANEQGISIHALFAEGDLRITRNTQWMTDFYPRPLLRGRRESNCLEKLQGKISIHALFAEGDMPSAIHLEPVTDFYPRPLRRGRQEIETFYQSIR